MTDDLILLTGATGFLGYQVLITALQAGHHVRCAVRSAGGIGRILSSPGLAELGPLSDYLSWAIVPDITVDGAYDDAVAGTSYIIHVASPVEADPVDTSTSGAKDEAFVKPAVSGVIGMLESAAAHSPTLRRIVVTSSIVAIFPTPCFLGDIPPNTKPFDADHRLPDLDPPYEPGLAYFASKIAALNTSEAWMKKHKLAFDMNSILPAWIWGRHGLATTPDQLFKGSNGALMNILTGRESQHPINSAVVSVATAAKAHLLALDPNVPGNQAFIVGKLENLETANTIMKKHFSDAVSGGIFSSCPRQATFNIPMNVEKTEKVLGLKVDSLEDMVREVAAQYLELV
ncbi:hypothetical protein B0T10DRAFT_407487 [Thelonectria olida]|uniref:NAD-dependent epimerase/dehydratase domain-containing protein n=1 Tax=Thelonectria olida TaxID=1576542 RepID=A0A9P8W265_9HYPO|nr:hypothetical protein B0T10DRAFT_407487 [Thelonectria olida]